MSTEDIARADRRALADMSLRNRPNVAVTFSIERPQGLRLARWNSIVRHFERLGLIERYDQIGNDEPSEVFGKARDFLDNGGPCKKVNGFLRLGAGRFAAVDALHLKLDYHVVNQTPR